jgi:hypothetical protein
MTHDHKPFRLNAPTKAVFWSSAVIAAAGVVLTLIPGPFWLSYAWLLIVAGYLTLVAGVTMKGL